MGGYRGSQGNKKGYKGLQLVTGVTGNNRLLLYYFVFNFSVLLETVRLMNFFSQLWYTRW